MSGWDEDNGTMECVYFGTDITWGGHGEGNGPWIAADLENGMYKCDKGGWGSDSLQDRPAFHAPRIALTLPLHSAH